MINFKLQHIDSVAPAGSTGDYSMSWFWLTEADLWLKFDRATIYEYSPEAMEYFGDKPTPYNDYPLVRYIEDFTELFGIINESIPDKLYEIVEDLEGFYFDAEKWYDIIDPDEEEIDEESFRLYTILRSWAYERSFDSGHLTGGPTISFFRNNDKIKIVWKVNHKLENGIDLWTAKDGFTEMEYPDFIEKVKEFGVQFFREMDNQVNLAIDKDWKDIKIDKVRLKEEHKERKEDFYHQLDLLEGKPENKTDWIQVINLLERMKEEIKTKA